MTVKDKLTILTNAIAGSNKPFPVDDLEAVETFIHDCGNYVKKITTMEAELKVSRLRMEADEYRDLVVLFDKNRKIAQDALIASVQLINRLCNHYDVVKIYEGDKRTPIDDFALEVATEYYKGRKL